MSSSAAAAALCAVPKDSLVRKVGGARTVSSRRRVRFSVASALKSREKLRVGVLGASGYTDSLLLANHPNFQITLMTADRKAGMSIGSAFPPLITQALPDMIAIRDADFSTTDAIFCCLHHATTQEMIKPLPTELKVVHLSADFRLRNVDGYHKWYGQKEATYGLAEIQWEIIKNSRLVANP